MRPLKKMKACIGAMVVFIAVFSPGCEKVETDLYYNVVGYLDLPDVDSLITYSKWTNVFVHYADTAEWEVRSYEDALKGIITHKETSQQQDPEYQGWLTDDEIAVRVGPFTALPVMLVACDTEGHDFYESKMYAWRAVDVQAGLSLVRIPVIFTPEKGGDKETRIINGVEVVREKHINSKWFICNDNPYDRNAGNEEEEEEEEGSGGSGR